MAKTDKPNILVIWGDDIGISNLSCYSHGLMGYHTPNIDRLAKEGMLFTDSYGEQSCTAGRSSFITGQSVFRTGLSKVGIPAAPIGMSEKILTIAGALKNQGYATGQFGKNHLGDLNHMLPTNHGFDEFFGNLYHLNAEEEPEMDDYYPEKDFAEFRKAIGPRGVIHSWATDKDDPTEQPRWGKIGKQRIDDTGPLNMERMETCDDEFVAAAKDFMKRQKEAGKPFFVWLNTTHMHLFTHPKPESKGQAGRWQSPYHDTMIDHDKNVGQMLDYLDEMGLADNTFVMYSTDNGPHRNSWPDGGMTPFRSEKNTNWEGAFRIPLIVRWPGKIKPGTVSNEIIQHHDWFPTFLAMAGDSDVVEKVKKGYQAIGRNYKNHIDGVNLLPYLTGKEKEGPARGSSTSATTATSSHSVMTTGRSFSWSSVATARCKYGRSRSRACGCRRFTTFEPIPTSSRTSPRTPTTSWVLYHAYILYGAYALADKFAATFKEFPPIQKPNTFTIDDALAAMASASAGG